MSEQLFLVCRTFDALYQPFSREGEPPVDIVAKIRAAKELSEALGMNIDARGEGAVIHKHACALGCEGIVSKRLG
jgi:hypothetical protein